MNVNLFLAVNSTLNGHLLVAWAMGLNAYAWASGVQAGAWGVLAGALALALAHLLSTAERALAWAGWAYPATFGLTLLSWLIWFLPALLR